MTRNTVAVLLTFALVACVAGTAHAAGTTPATQQYDTFMSLFSNTAKQWQGVLQGYANRIFWILAGIDLILVFFPLAFRGSEMGEVVGELVRFVLIIGFFYLMLMKGPEWANYIVQSLREAGAKAGGHPVMLYPGSIFATGLKIGEKATSNLSVFSPGNSFAFVMAWAVLILAFGYMAAIVGVTLIESYVIIYGAVIFLGLGGSRFTRDYAITVLRYALAVGAKLFTITLVINLIQGAFAAWGTYWNDTLTAASSLMGLSVMAALITKMVPDLVQAMITGQSGVGNHVGSMATTVLAAGAAAASGGMLGAAAAGGMGGGPVSGGAALGEAMQSSMMQRPGLTPGLGAGGPMPGGASPGGGARPAATAAPRSASPMAGGSPAAGGKRHAAFKSVGTLAELVVPGMEGASAVGVAPQPGPMPDLTPGGEGDFASSDAPAMTATPVDESVIEAPKST